jgi:hypothetical protein
MFSPEFLSQGFGLLEAGGIRSFRAPAIERREECGDLRALALLLLQAREAHGGAPLQGCGLLVAVSVRKRPMARARHATRPDVASSTHGPGASTWLLAYSSMPWR